MLSSPATAISANPMEYFSSRLSLHINQLKGSPHDHATIETKVPTIHKAPILTKELVALLYRTGREKQKRNL
jgi:hypothetical protein